jgi:hypothetical protein
MESNIEDEMLEVIDWQQEMYPPNAMSFDKVARSDESAPSQMDFTAGSSFLDGLHWQPNSSNINLLSDPVFGSTLQDSEDMSSLSQVTDVMDTTFDLFAGPADLPATDLYQMQPHDPPSTNTLMLNNMIDLSATTEDRSAIYPTDWSTNPALFDNAYTRPDLIHAPYNGPGVQNVLDQLMPAGLSQDKDFPYADILSSPQPGPFTVEHGLSTAIPSLVAPIQHSNSPSKLNREIDTGPDTTSPTQPKSTIKDIIATSQGPLNEVPRFGPRLRAIQPRKDSKPATGPSQSIRSLSTLNSRVSKTRRYSTKAAPRGCFLIEPAGKKHPRSAEPRSKKACLRCVVQKVKVRIATMR